MRSLPRVCLSTFLSPPPHWNHLLHTHQCFATARPSGALEATRTYTSPTISLTGSRRVYIEDISWNISCSDDFSIKGPPEGEPVYKKSDKGVSLGVLSSTAGATCDVHMFDSYGDGWSGNKLTVSVEPPETFEMDGGEYEKKSFTVPDPGS